MTYSHRCEPVPVPSRGAALGTLRAHGLRISTARRLVIDALFAAEAPLSAETIAREVGVDLASVYRNLDALEAAGIARHVHVGHAAGRYLLAARLEGGYAACEQCGRHVTLDGDGVGLLRAAVRDLCGFDCGFAHFPLVGICPDCEALR